MDFSLQNLLSIGMLVGGVTAAIGFFMAIDWCQRVARGQKPTWDDIWRGKNPLPPASKRADGIARIVAAVIFIALIAIFWVTMGAPAQVRGRASAEASAIYKDLTLISQAYEFSEFQSSEEFMEWARKSALSKKFQTLKLRDGRLASDSYDVDVSLAKTGPSGSAAIVAKLLISQDEGHYERYLLCSSIHQRFTKLIRESEGSQEHPKFKNVSATLLNEQGSAIPLSNSHHVAEPRCGGDTSGRGVKPSTVEFRFELSPRPSAAPR